MSDEEELPPHFVELEILDCTGNRPSWQEKARWIKLEEQIEDSGNWSKPFIPLLSYFAVSETLYFLNEGHLLLDISSVTLQDIADEICALLLESGVLSGSNLNTLHDNLLAGHRHQHQCNETSHPKAKEVVKDKKNRDCKNVTEITVAEQNPKEESSSYSSAVKYMTPDSEASVILVTTSQSIAQPLIVFVRLRSRCNLGNLSEIPVPVRFLFLVLGTREGRCDDDYQVGRSLGTMMSNDDFFKIATHCQTKKELLDGIGNFMSEAIILPHGDWDQNSVNQSYKKFADTRKNARIVNSRLDHVTTSGEQKHIEKMQQDDLEQNPFYRSGRLFGGIINDIQRKLPHLKSDFTEAFNLRCLMVVVFIYFSFLSTALTFGALLSNKTEGLLGVNEMLLSAGLSGLVFGLFSGQPMIILGATGPMLILEEAIYDLSQHIEVEFLPWRLWIGLWTSFFCTLIVAFELVFMVEYFTMFTEEIVAAVISSAFIHEALGYLWNILQRHYFDPVDRFTDMACSANVSMCTNSSCILQISPQIVHVKQANEGLAFVTFILLLGTFWLCNTMRKMRHSKLFPLKLSRLLSDFGIMFAVFVFMGVDWLFKDNYTPKLDVPMYHTSTTSTKRGWVIEPFGREKALSAPAIVTAAIPAFLVTIILFMETELTGLLVDRKEHKLKKGAGYSLDIFITGILTCVCSVLGLPWMCACPVHSISHLNSLSVLSSNHPPGTKPKILKVIEQRVTNIAIHLLIGVTVLLSPLLRQIPIAVLFGVFLYLGFTYLSHLQLIKRVKLLFVPYSAHEDLKCVSSVKTRKMHAYTCVQLTCFAIILTVKNSILAPSFPLFTISLIPLRKLLTKFFTEEEIRVLEKEDPLSEAHDEYDVGCVPM